MEWVKEVVAKQERFYRALNAQNDRNAYYAPLRSTPPGWLFIKREVTCVPDPAHPWDPKVVKAIQEFAPEITPIWVRYVYKEPTDWGTHRIHIIGRHGIASINKDPLGRTTLSTIPIPTMPCQGVTFEAPNQEEWVFRGGEDQRAKDLPGKYVPFDWEVYYFVKKNYRKPISHLKKIYIDDPYKALKAAEAYDKQQHTYALSHVQKFAKAKMDQASDVEAKNYFLSIGERRAETKPTVDLGAKSTPTESSLPAKE